MLGKGLEGARLLLVGAHDDYWDNLGRLLRQRGAFESVERVHSAREAIESAPRLRPHVVLADASLPDGSGFELARRFKTLPTPPRVLILTFYGSQAVRVEASAAGADACLAKTEASGALFSAIAGALPTTPDPSDSDKE